MDKLRAAVSEFKNYTAKMKAAGRYDYDDMILWVLRAFREDEEILRKYQERYQYILVDEFQDTSGSQNELLRFILNYWETTNVFLITALISLIAFFPGALPMWSTDAQRWPISAGKYGLRRVFTQSRKFRCSPAVQV